MGRLTNFATGLNILKDDSFGKLGKQIASNSAASGVHGRTIRNLKRSKSTDEAMNNLGGRNEALVRSMRDPKNKKHEARNQSEINNNSDTMNAMGKGGNFDDNKAAQMGLLRESQLQADQKTWGSIKEAPGLAKDYFIGGDFKQNAARIGAAAGAYGAANVGMRAINGGGVTYNNQGQRDIAGIPFV